MRRLKTAIALCIVTPIAVAGLIGFFGRMWWERND